MGVYLVEMFGISLTLTLAIELPAAAVCGMRTKKGLLLVGLVNVLTNPPAVLLNLLARSTGKGFLRLQGADGRFWPVNLWAQIVIEAAVLLTEWLIYRSFAKDAVWKIRRPFRLAAVTNACSYLGGLLINYIYYLNGGLLL